MKRLFFALALMAVFLKSVEASDIEKQNPWLPNTDLDVISYDLSLNVPDLAHPQFQAKLKIILKTQTNTKSIKLHIDAKRIAVSEIKLNGAVTGFEVLKGVLGKFDLTGDVLAIAAIQQLKAKESQTLELTYTVNVAETQIGFFLSSNVLSTRSWPYYARTWMPSHDHPNDAATFAVEATVPKDFMLLSNGSLVQTKYSLGEDGLEFVNYRWEIAVPIPTYDMSVVIGKFAQHTRQVCFNRAENSDETIPCETAQTRIPATFYIPEGHPQTQQYLNNFDKSNHSLVWFANTLGEYEYPKSGFVVTPHPFSMEHAGLITLVNPGSAVHEVAHHWWGNSVHIAHWGDFWISEGFTTYMDGLYDEHLTGEDTSCRKTQGKLNASADTDPMTIFDNTPYCKGAAALHGLRETIATLLGQPVNSAEVKTVLYATLRSIYQEYRFKKLSTSELLKYLDHKLPGLLEGVDRQMVKDALNAWKAAWFEIL